MKILFIISVVFLIGLFAAFLNFDFPTQIATRTFTTTSSIDSRANQNPEKDEPRREVPSGAWQFSLIGNSKVSYELTSTSNTNHILTGNTSSITGNGWFDLENYNVAVYADIDLHSFTSDDSQRDNAMRSVFKDKIGHFEINGFNIEEPLIAGQSFLLKLPGKMKINNITQPVEFDVNGVYSGNEVTAEGVAPLYLNSYEIKPPQGIDNEMYVKFEIKITK